MRLCSRYFVQTSLSQGVELLSLLCSNTRCIGDASQCGVAGDRGRGGVRCDVFNLSAAGTAVT